MAQSIALRVNQQAANIEALVLEQVAQPQPKADEGFAIVKVASAAVNPSDVKATLGFMPKAVFPRTPGRDFAGLVVDGPSTLVGQEVWGSAGDLGITANGSHAHYLCLPVAAVMQKPKALSLDEAGSVGVPFVTAYEGLRRAGYFDAPKQEAKTVVVMGANGKVGQAAVQLAARAGSQVIAVQRQPSLQGHACAPVNVVDASKGDVAEQIMTITKGRGADLVYNTVDSVYFAAGNAVLAKQGVHVFIIAKKGQTVPFDVFSFYRGMHTFVGIDTLALTSVESCKLMDAMHAGFDDGSLKPFPINAANVLPLTSAYTAYQRVLAGDNNRLVLKP